MKHTVMYSYNGGKFIVKQWPNVKACDVSRAHCNAIMASDSIVYCDTVESMFSDNDAYTGKPYTFSYITKFIE